MPKGIRLSTFFHVILYFPNFKKLLVPSYIHNYSILILKSMKTKGPKVFKLIIAKFALDFIKNNTSSASASEGIIFDKIQGIVF